MEFVIVDTRNNSLDLCRIYCFNEGMSLVHIPVMLEEILAHLAPALEQLNPRYLDCTFGRGGHLQALLNKYPTLSAVALDRDPQAIEYGRDHFAAEISAGRLQIEHLNFSDFSSEKFGMFNAILVDLGVSSPQLDDASRGFSFYNEGPLDMRMDTTQTLTAANLIAECSEDELIEIFKSLGEVQKPFRVVRAIVHDRKTKPFVTTRELASLIERVEGWRRKGFHPATQYFMALRLAVNAELRSVETALLPLIHGLKPRGRLAVLTFHSLEDRIVKNMFRQQTELGQPVFKKVIQAGREEEVKNPRSRSAKLRIFERSETVAVSNQNPRT